MIGKMTASENGFNIPAKNRRRMVILGSSKVGKTAIVSRFLSARVDEQYTPTVEDFHRKLYSIRGSVYQLDILDTSGNHPFPATRRLSILTGDVFILVFSLDNRDSFQEAQRLKRLISETKSCLRNKTKESAEVPLVICGNKCDRESQRQVRREEAEQLAGGADEGRRCAYFEVSAKKNTDVERMFRALLATAKLPDEMSPGRHCKVSLQSCELLLLLLRRKSFRARSRKDAYGIVTPLARRPSVHSDLMYIREKAVAAAQAKEKACVIC